MTVRIYRDPRASTRGRFGWPWLHWCVFDRECRYWGVPARVHIWPLSLAVELREEPLRFPNWPGIRPRPPDWEKLMREGGE